MTNVVWGIHPLSEAVTNGIVSEAVVMWCFERGAEVLRLEATIDPRTREYVLVVDYAGRFELTERYQRYPEFLARMIAIDHRLMRQHWSQVEVHQTPRPARPHRSARIPHPVAHRSASCAAVPLPLRMRTTAEPSQGVSSGLR